MKQKMKGVVIRDGKIVSNKESDDEKTEDKAEEKEEKGEE